METATDRGIAPRLHLLLLGILLVTPALLGSLASVVSVLLALALMPALRNGGWRQAIGEPGMAVFLAVFGVLLLLFAVTARQPGDLAFAANFLALALAPALYLMARREAAETGMRRLCQLALAGALASAAVAVYDVYVQGEVRAHGGFGGPNLLGRIGVLLGFLGLAGLPLIRGWPRLLLHAGPASALVVVVLSGSRGAGLAIPPLLLLGTLFLLGNPDTRRHAALLLAVTALTWLGLVWLVSPEAGARIAGLGSATMETLDAGEGADTSIMARFDLIRVGLAAFLQSPLVGHGWAHLGSVAAAIDPEGPGRLWGSYFSYHNDAVNFAVAGGAIGIACWLALLAAPLLGPRPAILPARSRCAADRSLGYARWMLVLGCAVFGLTDMVLGYDLPTTLHAFIGASLLGWSRQAGR